MSKKEKSQLVEDIQQETVEAEEQAFDAAKFLEDETIEPVETKDSPKSKEDNGEDGFAWNSIEIEEDQEVDAAERGCIASCCKLIDIDG